MSNIVIGTREILIQDIINIVNLNLPVEIDQEIIKTVFLHIFRID